MTGRTGARWSATPDAAEGMRVRLGENMRVLRARLHVSQEELASRADIHRTQISMIESGHRQPLTATTLKLAAALGVEVGTLLDGIVYRPRLFSAARGAFEISPTPLFDVGSSGDPRGGAGR
jgi:transcriptional regulator with XRE-family HTH domain